MVLVAAVAAAAAAAVVAAPGSTCAPHRHRSAQKSASEHAPAFDDSKIGSDRRGGKSVQTCEKFVGKEASKLPTAGQKDAVFSQPR
jgi:hypothetical protein